MQEFILTFFYSGKIKKAPGTFGSIAAILFFLAINFIFSKTEVNLFWQNIFWIFFLSISFVYGCIFSKSYAANFGEIDHPSIVLDEVVGQIIALLIISYFTEINLISVIFAFILFRFFDIKKPLFIGYCDRKIKNGFGVMFDDLISGIIAGFLTIFIFSFL